MPPDIVDFDFRSVRGHEYGSLDLEKATTVSNTLSMVARTGCGNSSVFFILCKPTECSGSSPDLETADRLEIFALEEDISLVFFGEEGGPLQFSVGDYGFVLAVGLVDLRSRNELR